MLLGRVDCRMNTKTRQQHELALTDQVHDLLGLVMGKAHRKEKVIAYRPRLAHSRRSLRSSPDSSIAAP